MPSNYVLLESVTVGEKTASSIVFSNIPQSGYTDLYIKFSGRNSGNFFTFSVSCNDTSVTQVIRLFGNGTSPSSDTFNGHYTAFSSGLASVYGNADIYISNYTTSNFKNVMVDAVSENNTTAAYMNLGSGLYASTSAITSVSLIPESGTFAQYTTASLYGVSALNVTPTIAPKAIGGDIIQADSTYWYHAFLNSGTFTPVTNLTCDYLVVGGGGGGGTPSGDAGGGGGAGGYITSLGGSALSLSANTVYTAIVGAGGSPSGYGSDSIFATITATGGGRGGGDRVPGGNGGSGGGGGGGNSTVAGGTATLGQGNNGGTGSNSNANYLGGGGGGAGAVGGNVSYPSSTAGNGGIGLNTNSTWATVTGTGVSGYYAGGGGGCAKPAGTPGSGGTGGGGAGGANTNGSAGIPNTGGGGGGSTTLGAVGGSGIIIVRYAI